MQGQRIYPITPSNWTTVLPNIHHEAKNLVADRWSQFDPGFKQYNCHLGARGAGYPCYTTTILLEEYVMTKEESLELLKENDIIGTEAEGILAKCCSEGTCSRPCIEREIQLLLKRRRQTAKVNRYIEDESPKSTDPKI